MSEEQIAIVSRLLLAVLAGGLIGFERTYDGRAAGFRTHTLVCTASSLLMLLTVYQWKLLADAPIETIRVDPTRMAQGIMTGVGFLGAGVITKESLTIHGLTTAASIWITASIGILIGVGFYLPAFFATGLTLGTLSLFRRIESVTPSLHYGKALVRFWRKDVVSESQLREAIRRQNVEVANPVYRLQHEGRTFEYELTVHTRDPKNFQRLAEALTAMPEVLEFKITPAGD